MERSKLLRLARLSTAIVLGEWQVVRDVRESAPDGEPDRAWREAVLQTHLFGGFPRLVEAYGHLAEVGGLGAPSHEEHEAAGSPERGAQLFDRIYGEGAEPVRSMLVEHSPDYAAMIAEHAYGRVLSRPGLDAASRELLASCALAALGQDRQLASHARGALRCGARFDALVDCFDAVRDLMTSERHERALRIAERFRSGD
jgi:alkylhydroperoxidase/carboxymuconolactone decarboxylase family protein YurZ